MAGGRKQNVLQGWTRGFAELDPEDLHALANCIYHKVPHTLVLPPSMVLPWLEADYSASQVTAHDVSGTLDSISVLQVVHKVRNGVLGTS